MTTSEDHLLFIEDATGQLDACDKSVLALDTALAAGAVPDKDDLNTLFRGVHTLKGNAGMVGCDRLVEVAHVLESLMDRLRAGTLTPTRELVDVIFSGLDTLRTLLIMFQQGTADSFDATEFLHYLQSATQPAAPTGGRLAAMFPGLTLTDPAAHAAQLGDLDAGLARVFRLEFRLDGADAAGPLAHPALEKLLMLGHPVAWRWLAPGQLEVAYLTRADQGVVERFAPDELASVAPWAGPGASEAPAPVAEAPVLAPAATPDAPHAEPGESSLRVSVNLLDKLMNLVGELVLTRNQILQRLSASEDAGAAAPVQRLSQLTTELQEAVMRTRMQTVGQIWDKFPRLVRDYARQSGKQIQLVQEGADTEIDKSLLEAIKDPLTHLVRNALDHGLESPDDRLAAGKPPLGTITLAACHAGGNILLEIRDDGRGLALEKIRDKALARGLASAEQLDRLTPAELAQLIFQPGFSTAEAVTNISGRGVGMDVVKSNIERVGGAIDVHSEPGRGCAMRLRIPLTLAVMPALILRQDAERFAMPQSAVLEVVALGDGLPGLEPVRDSLVYRLRHELVPVVSLREVLGAPAAEPGYLVVLQSGTTTFGLAVDGIGDTQEIVVKSLPSFLKGLDAYAGVTIMGDGQACMILNAASLGARAGLDQLAPAPTDSSAADAANGAGARQRMLLVKLGDRAFAVPMALVSRLETFEAARLEKLGDRQVVQYGERLLNVAEVEPLLGLPPSGVTGTVQVVVLGEGDRQVGMRVAEILDIVEDQMAIHPVSGVRGVIGAAVIGGVATELLDVHALMADALAWTAHPPREQPLKRLLLVEDSAFFRTLVRSHLEGAGYTIFEAGDGEEGLRVLAHEPVDLVLSDIEMPQVDGLTFIRRVRAQAGFARLPAIALTSVDDPEMRDAALRSGFDMFLTKYDRDAVMGALSRFQAAARPISEALRA